MIKLNEIARTSDLFVVYAITGASQTIHTAAGDIFRPEAVSISKAENGELNFVGLVGPKAHFDGTSISYSGAEARIFTRDEILGEPTEDVVLELELNFVSSVLMAALREEVPIVATKLN